MYDPRTYWSNRPEPNKETTIYPDLENFILGEYKKGDKVLDFSGGTGRNAIAFRKASEVHGIDIHTSYVDKWMDAMNNAGIEDYSHFGAMPTSNIPDNGYDVVFAIDVLQHVPDTDIEAVWNELKRIGKKVVALAGRGHATKKPAKHCFIHEYEKWHDIRYYYLIDNGHGVNKKIAIIHED